MKDFKSRFCMSDQGFLAMTHKDVQTTTTTKIRQVSFVRSHTAPERAYSVII